MLSEYKTTYTLLALALAGLMAASCASSAPVAAPKVSATAPPPSSTPSPLAERAKIDAAGAAADCAPYRKAPASQPWLGAWCGLRTRDWKLAARAARSARWQFAAAGELRRQIAMMLVEAIADAQLGEVGGDDGAADLAGRAHQLWLDSQMPMHGGLRDRYAGDLPFLYALAIEHRVLREPRTRAGITLKRRALLDIARWEYDSFERRAAIGPVLRAQARLALDEGDLGRALARLQDAMGRDRRAERVGALRRDLALFARLARTMGAAQTRLAAELAALPTRRKLGSLPKIDALSAPLLDAMMDTPTGRLRLAALIAEIRRSADSAIRPPTVLVRSLKAHKNLSSWTGPSWKLAYQGGQLLVERGLRADGQRYLRAAVGAIERMRASLPTPGLRQRFFADKRPVYMALVDTYVGLDTAHRAQSDYRHGLRLANALKARGLLDLLDGSIAPELATSTAMRPSRRVPRTVQRTADEALKRLSRWTKAARHIDPTPTQFGELPGAVTGKLGPKTAVLDYLIAAHRSYVWVLTDAGIEMRRLAGRETIAPLVDQFIATLGHTDTRAERRRHRKLAERLFVELVGPIEDLVKDDRRLIVAPDDKLYALPFETLARPEHQKRPHYLVFDRVVSYTPSSAVLARLMRRGPAPASSRALVVGAPDLKRPALDLLALSRDLPETGMFSLDEMFPALPGARAELRAVARRLRADHLDVDTLTGKKAAESRLRRADLTRYGVIHVATHGVSDATSLHVNATDRVDFDQPALLLSRAPDQPDDGIVTLGELLNRKTAARLVVLSGCTTGRGWHTLGQGAFGLAGAILYTGSHNVVASTWSVADADTSRLMKAFYRALSRGMTPAQALRLGQIAMAKKGMRPASWAAFHIVGGG